MIKSIRFQNFKALRDATLPLGPFTLIVGPNGSGKSTAMQAFGFLTTESVLNISDFLTVGLEGEAVAIQVAWTEHGKEFDAKAVLKSPSSFIQWEETKTYSARVRPNLILDQLRSFRVFSFDSHAIQAPVATTPHPQLGPNGSNLPAVLDSLRDTHPERFEDLNSEFHRWLPEFDRILFETPTEGMKRFLVRTSKGHFRLRASDLSQGVLFALAFLTLAYLPTPPSIICFEEPDRGIHPRLLMDIRDAMYRLAFPENYGEKRQPVQVIATTHSPYLLDLYKEHPEQIVIAHKDQQGVHFERLADKPHLNEILEGAPLGDIWLTGILGGVPPTP